MLQTHGKKKEIPLLRATKCPQETICTGERIDAVSKVKSFIEQTQNYLLTANALLTKIKVLIINFLKTTDFSTANVRKASVCGEEIHLIRLYSHDTISLLVT